MPLYLGFDVRSESLTAIVIEIGDRPGATRRIAFHRSITFDSPSMWEDALDRVMGELATAAELDFDDLRGISGSATDEHPSPSIPAAALLALQPSRPLAPQLKAIASDEELRAMRESPRSFFTQLLESSYWQRRYSVPPARMVPWDTPHASTLIGTGIIRPGLLLASLGTSDTLADVNGMLTFRNGSLAREWMRLDHRLDRATFASLLDRRPGNDGYIMLPWLEPEITPPVAYAGVRRFGFDRLDPGRNVRGLVEGQMMAMANHAGDLGAALVPRSLGEGGIDRLIVTGADATNRPLLQVMANVFGVDVYRLDVATPPHDAKSASAGPGNAAALGAALRAYQADRLDSIEPVSWKTVVSVFTEPNPGHRVSPNPRHVAMYAELRREYAVLEQLHKDRPPIS
jgi:sugar (pentulose or hexulose) kinase